MPHTRRTVSLRQMRARLLALGLIAGLGLPTIALAQATGATPPGRDEFYWLSEINKASTVMVTETGIVPRDLGRSIAEAVAGSISEAETDRRLRSGDYLRVEERLIAKGGPEVTRLHSGRSRQDIGATSRRLFQRDQILATLDSLEAFRAILLDFAATHPDAIVPAYTQGVQAQPISFGHYVLGYSQAYERSSARLREAFARANQSPLGSGALGTSSFPVDRSRLAALLGFDAAIVNSLDASQLSPIDAGAEQAAAAASIALTTGAFVSDLEAQYRMTTPWLTLTEGAMTGVSSIMPQKRNPNSLTAVRVAASAVLGEATTYYFKAHNVPHGVPDSKGQEPQNALREAATLLYNFGEVVTQLNFNAQRALDEVNADYAATTELADILQRDANVPFRVGHHFASNLVTFGRSAGLRPSQIRYRDAQLIYARAARHFELSATRLPLDEKTFRRALTAENMVRSSRGLGGPQPSEVARMLAAQRIQLASDRAWTSARRGDLEQARERLNSAFEQIRSAP